jgi:hypothetical protein
VSTEIAAVKQRGRPFVKGQSGNPRGKPKGVRNRATLAAEALLDGEAEALTRKAVEMALGGDVMALKAAPQGEAPVICAAARGERRGHREGDRWRLGGAVAGACDAQRGARGHRSD